MTGRREDVTILRRTRKGELESGHTSCMRRRWLAVVVLGFVATGCGGKTQEQNFRQDGVDAAEGNVWSQNDCSTAARAEVASEAKSHPTWTPTQRDAYEAAYVDGCLSAIKPLQGTAQ